MFNNFRPLGKWRNAIIAAFACAVIVPLAVPDARAETLVDALKRAYLNNPQLRAERARQRGTDEELPQVLSGWRPTIIADGDAGTRNQKFHPSGLDYTDTPRGADIVLSQPIFDGFKTVAGTKQAKASIKAGRQELLSVEQQVLLDAATAYMNVIRDIRIVALRRRDVSALREQLAASKARFEVGEITNTDVWQSRGRLSLAQSELALSKSSLASSRATYERVVGRKAGKLKYPHSSRRIPKSLANAIRIARDTNPQLLAAAYDSEAARHNIDVVRGDLLPSLSLQASYQWRGDPSRTTSRSRSGQLVGLLSVPLYQAGRVQSQLRQAKHQANARRLQVLDSQRQVREQVKASWSNLVAARQSIVSLRRQVKANQVALDGVRQEALVGTRSTIDVLDAIRELVAAKVNLTSVERNEIVAGYQVLASIGRMTARNLRLSVPIYDPKTHGNAVKDKWIGTNVKLVE